MFSAEYAYITAAIRDHVMRQSQILQNGLTVIMGAFAVAFGGLGTDNHLLSAVIFCFVIPALCFVMIFLWQAEVIGGERLGLYLVKREAEIAKLFSLTPMDWESWIRRRNSKTYQYEAAFLIMTFLWMCASGAGYIVFDRYFGRQMGLLQLEVDVIVCSTVELLLWWRLKPFWGYRHETGTEIQPPATIG